ncbi:MAG: MotA/TolQ/ExbB proton channel family protein [Pirellula sp.]|jgi:biopolymer transport protein ExbB
MKFTKRHSIRNAWSRLGFFAFLSIAMLLNNAGSLWAQNNRWNGPQPPNGFATPAQNGFQNQGFSTANNPANASLNSGNRAFSDPRLAAVPNAVTSGSNSVTNGNVTTNSGSAVTNGQSVTSSKPDAAASTEGKIPVRNLLQIFHDGGLMMYPIALCSFALMVFSFERLIHLRRGRVIPRPFVNRLIEQIQNQQVDRDESIELCEKNPSAMGHIMIAALKRYGKPSVEVEQAVLDAGERESNHLRKHLRILNAISNVAPLLGLLGTVLGMIQSFNDISNSQAMGRPEMLAGGISQALLTTAAGLLVAIPAYVMHVYFVGHIDRLIMEMDTHAQRLIDVVSAEGLQENDVGRTRTRSRKAA